MWPAIRDGERILVAPVRPERLRIGDVAQYVVAEGTRVHRLLARSRGADGLRFAFVGDNDDAPPDLVAAADLVGRVVAVERAGRVVRLDSFSARVTGWLKIARRRMQGVSRGHGP